MKIGYARVSTTAQNPQLQLDALTAAGVDEADIYVDHASGSTLARPQLEAALRQLRVGDVLVVWKLDRLARSTTDLIRQVRHLEERGVEFASLTEALDTTTAGGRFVFTVMAGLAELERDLIRERTAAGLEAARRQGRRGGRPTVITPARRTVARQQRDQGATLDQIAATLNVSRASVIRMLATAPPKVASDSDPARRVITGEVTGG